MRRSGSEAFFTHVDKNGPGGCWLWRARLDRDGYGRVTYQGEARLAHRVVFAIQGVAIPAGFHVDHLCRVRNCVNPLHLEFVTPEVNNARSLSPTAMNARQTHCHRGHEFNELNTYTDRQRRRHCRECRRVRYRAAKGIAA